MTSLVLIQEVCGEGLDAIFLTSMQGAAAGTHKLLWGAKSLLG